MKRFTAFLCTLAMILTLFPATAFSVELDAEEIIVLEADASNITISCDTTIDLNGHNIDGVTVTGGTLYCLDSQTADYTVADGVYGKVTNVTGTVKAADGYLQVENSFHRVNLDIYSMTLRASDVGVYYKSNFAADEVVAAQVESYGVALSVVAAPNADNLDSYCGYSVFTGFKAGEGANSTSSSTLLKNIMKVSNGDNKNAKNAAMPVYGRAYIKTAEGYFFGKTVKRSLQQQVEAINDVWKGLKYSQQSPVLEMLETYAFAKESWNIPNVEGILVPGISSEIEIPISVNAENGIVTKDATVSAEGASVTVPAGTQLSENAEALTLTVTPKAISDADLTYGDSEVLLPIDVHMDGMVADNTLPMLITLEGCLPKGLNNGNAKLYHVENGQTVAMTQVATPANHNEFSYDPLTGNVVLAMASFSEVAMLTETQNTWDGSAADAFAGGSGTEADPYLIANAHQLAYFRNQVDNGVTYAGQYVQLGSNIHLDKVNFDPIGYGYECDKYMTDGMTFNGTFDGAGHTISGLYQNGWDLGSKYSYSMAGGGLFASVVDATIKNVKINSADIIMECVDMGILVGYSQGNCTFENISIHDSTIANYQRATGGVVGEVSPRRNADGSLMFATNTHTFRNIHVGHDVIVGSLWGDFDAPVGGVLGARWDANNSTLVVMENITVACQLDVYNDVTAAYRWHAYRRAGMLIGNTDSPTANGKIAQTATAPFLTCKNVTVYLGDWVNYHYCQFTNENNPGKNYPWVRVEEGKNCSPYSNPRYGQPEDVNGNQVSNANHTHKVGDECHLEIPFAQLYGGGQGVYGATFHDGVTITRPVYTITYIADMVVDEVIYVTDNTKPYTLKKPGDHMQWLTKEGEAITEIPAGNTTSRVFYLDDADRLIAHFVDINGVGVGHVEFTADTKTLEGLEPPVPQIPGYYGQWEHYELKGASIVIKPVYTLEQQFVELYKDMDIDTLFELLSGGNDIVMTQELSGKQGSANKNTCAVITDTRSSHYVDTDTRLNLNGYTLHFNFASSANKDWKIFDIRDGSSLTISGGIYHGGILHMELTKFNDNCDPVVFNLDPGATLVLEKGAVIELHFPKGEGEHVALFSINGEQFGLHQAEYPQLKYEFNENENYKRITALETTIITVPKTAQ